MASGRNKQVPKKHHYVPQMLLRRFTHDGRLWYWSIERDEKPRPSRPTEIAHVNQGHTVITRDGSKDHDSLERAMSDIEGAASRVITQIEQNESLNTLCDEQIVPLAWLASLQQARSRTRMAFIAQQADLLAEGSRTTGSAYETQTALLRATTTGLLSSWFLRDDESARPKEQWDGTASLLCGLRWDVMRYEEPGLIVTDAFAAQFGVRDDVDVTADTWGAKFGLNTPPWAARGFTIALTPRIALHLHHGDTRKPVAAAAVNMHSIRSARAFLAFPYDRSPADVLPPLLDWVLEAKGVRSVMPKSL